MDEGLSPELLEKTRRVLDRAVTDHDQAAKELDALLTEHGSTLVTVALGAVWGASVSSVRRGVGAAVRQCR